MNRIKQKKLDEKNPPNKRNESNFFYFMLSFPSQKKDKEVED